MTMISCHAWILLGALLSPTALSFSPLARSIQISRATTTAFVPPTILFSDVSDTQDEAAVVESAAEPAEVVEGDDAEPKKRVIKRERHTLFVGNLPFGKKSVQ